MKYVMKNVIINGTKRFSLNEASTTGWHTGVWQAGCESGGLEKPPLRPKRERRERTNLGFARRERAEEN